MKKKSQYCFCHYKCIAFAALIIFGGHSVNAQKLGPNWDFYLGTGLTTVKIIDYPDATIDYYELLPVFSFEANARRNVYTKSNFSFFYSVGLSRLGFEGRRQVEILSDETRVENWSKFHLFNTSASGGMTWKFEKTLALRASAKGMLYLTATEKMQEVHLKGYNDPGIFYSPQKSKAQGFGRFNFGIDLSVVHWLNDRLSVELGGFYGLPSIRPDSPYGLRLVGINVGLAYNFCNYLGSFF